MKIKTYLFFLLLSLLNGLKTFAQDEELRTVIQRGHEAPVLIARFSSNGQYVATGSKDNTAIIWEAASGRQLRTFYGHHASVNALDFHPTDYLLVTAADDKKIIIWNLITGEKQFEHDWDSWISDISFSPDGNYLLIGGGKYEAELFDWREEKAVHQFKVRKTQYGVELGFSADGSKAFIGNDDGRWIVHDVQSGESLDTLRNLRSSSCGGCLLHFDIDDERMLSVARSGPLTLWDWPTGSLITEIGEAENDFQEVALSDSYVFAEDEKQIYQWSLEGELVRTFGEGEEELNGIHLSPNDSFLLSYGNDRVTRIWDAYTGELVQELSGYLNRSNDRGLSFGLNSYWHSGINKYLSIRNRSEISPDGQHIIRGHHNSSAYLWDTKSGRIKLELKGHEKIVVDYLFTPDSKLVYTASGDRSVRLWDVKTGAELRRFDGHRDLVFELALSEDGHYLVSGSWDGTAILWDTGTGEIVQQYRFDNYSPYTLSFAYHDQYLLIGGLDKKLKLIEIDTGLPVVEYVGHKDIVTDIVMSNESFMTASLDGMIKKWELKTGFQSKKYLGHTGAVYDICNDSHGLYFASGGADKTVRLWEQDGDEVKRFEGHTGAVTGVRFIQDDRVLVSSSLDGTTRYWDVETGVEIATHVFLGSHDWLTKSVRGYFDATEGARENIFFVKGLKSYSLDQFFEEFYRPDILEKSLELGSDVYYDSDLQQKLIDFPPPKVEIVSPADGEKVNSPELDLVVKLTNRGGGIDELRLLHNGKRILGHDRSVPDEHKDKKALYRHIPLTLVPGKNEISVSAFSQARIESDIVSRTLVYEGQPSSITCHVVTVGINAYKNPILNLNYARNDAEGFSELIKKGGKQLYDEMIFYPLYDEDATKENMLKVLDQVAEKAKPEDVLVFFYAGHGSTMEGDFYFIPTENVRLYDLKKLKSQALYAGDIQEKLSKIPALKQMVVIDACQSGSSTKLLASRGAEEEKALAQLSRSTGVHILAASGSEQFATEFEQLGHGLFTYVILDALGGKADGAPKDGKVTIYELKSYLDDQVPTYSIQFKGKPQFPVTYSQGQDFPIVID